MSPVMRLAKPNLDLELEAVEKEALVGDGSGASERPTLPASALSRALLEYEWALRSLFAADAGLPEPEEETKETFAVDCPAPRHSEVRELGKSFRRAG